MSESRTFCVGALLVVAAVLGPESIRAQPTADELEAKTLRPSTGMPSALDAVTLYELLIAELLLRGGTPGSAVPLVLGAARKLNDQALYQRAVEVAVQSQLGDLALQSSRAWIQAQPSNRLANRTYLQILIALNRVSDSMAALKVEVQRAPPGDRALAITSIPRLYQNVADRTLVAQMVESTLAEYLAEGAPAAVSIAAKVAVGRLHLAAGNLEEALRFARGAIRLDANGAVAGGFLLDLLERNPIEVEPLILEMLGREPPTEIRMRAARILIDQGRLGEALHQMDKVTSAKAAPLEAWLIRGSLQVQRGSPAEGEQSLRTYLDKANALPLEHRVDAIRFGLAQAYATLASVYEQRNEFETALSFLDRVEGPEIPAFVHIRRASIIGRRGDFGQGLSIIRQLPETSEAERKVKIGAEVQFLRRHKKYKLAFDVLGEALKRIPEDTELLYERAMMADRMGDWEVMESLLREVIRLQPSNHHAYNALGYALADRNVRIAEARELVAKALSAAPEDPFIQDSMAWVEYRSGNSKEAIRILEDAYRRRADAEIAAHLGEVLWTVGDIPRALEIWEQGRKLDPENETLRDTMRRFAPKQ